MQFVKIFRAPDEEAKKTLGEDLFKNFLPVWFGRMEKRIAANSNPNFFVGDKMTIADFAVGALMFSFARNPNNKQAEAGNAILANFPKFSAYLDNYGATMKSYLDGRPACEH